MLRKTVLFTFLGALCFIAQVIGSAASSGSISLGSALPIELRHQLVQALSSSNVLGFVFLYIVVGTSIHALILGVSARIFSDITRACRKEGKAATGWTIAGVMLTCGYLVLLNEELFPKSSAMPFLVRPSEPNLTYGLGLLLTVLGAYWFIRLANLRARVSCSVLVGLLFLPAAIPGQPPTDSSDRTNVILVGLDSFRLDHLKNDELATRIVPRVHRWLSSAVLFDDVTTPLARTFPALTSILTGLYPIHSGIRSNLAGKSDLEGLWTLPKYLSSNGYATVFSMDEVRFADFSEGFGFRTIVTPPVGLTDFLLGDAVDTVGTNLLTLVPIGAWLTPIHFANRGVSSIYKPSRYTARLKRMVTDLPDRSVMLMVHLTAAHWPYAYETPFDNQSFDQAATQFNTFAPYLRALTHVDGQFGDLMTQLKRRGLLKDAIVVVYADHGEELPTDRDRDFANKAGFSPAPFGHGTSVFSPAQNKVFIGIQRYVKGHATLQPGPAKATPAALFDIAPTILGMLKVPAPPTNALDGIDLLSPPNDIANRKRYIESAYLAPAIAGTTADQNTLVRNFGRFYRIDEEGKLIFRKALVGPTMKQYAVVHQGELVGLKRTAASHCYHGAEAGSLFLTVGWNRASSRPPSIKLSNMTELLDFFGLTNTPQKNILALCNDA
jgi:hypothetical protein